MNKTITINPSVFSIPKTKKNKKEKKEKEEKEPKTLNKQKLLGYIRKKQEDYEKNKISNEKQTSLQNTYEDMNKSNFENTLDFFKKIEDKEIVFHNQTVKTKKPIAHVLVNDGGGGVLPPPPNVIEQVVVTNPNAPSMVLTTPKYGVLKNGNLPTYRQYMNLPTPMTPLPPAQPTTQPPTQPQQHQQQQPTPQQQQQNQNVFKTKIVNKAYEHNNNIIEKTKHNNTKKVKKIIRRTFKTGRKNSNVGVLISNKTIRNEVMTKSQQLKQTPIKEVKEYLLKKRLIKIGSLAPNDVLRKMYESCSLICGEVQNHNNEILLYNFFNDNTPI